MIKKALTFTQVLIILFLVSILLATPVVALPLMPHVFYGSVFIDGSAAPNGLSVTATIAGVTFPSPVTTLTVNGQYGYDFQFKVLADDAETPVKEGGVDGDVITFKVDGLVAGSHIFKIGDVTRFDLSVTNPSSPSFPPLARRSLPDPSTLAMVGSGLAAALGYIWFTGLRRRLNRN